MISRIDFPEIRPYVRVYVWAEGLIADFEEVDVVGGLVGPRCYQAQKDLQVDLASRSLWLRQKNPPSPVAPRLDLAG